MSKIIQLSPKGLSKKMKNYLEEKNMDDEIVKHFKEKGFPCRLPYPITLSVLIDIAERLGIMNEEEVMPKLYKLRQELSQNIQEINN